MLFIIAVNACIVSGIFGQENANLARVVIMSFEDKTGTENFKYLSGSLREAINNSMMKNFTYEAVEFNKTDEVFSGIESTENANPVKKGKLEIVKMAAKELSADVVIFGEYAYSEKDNMILFNVSLYLPAADVKRDMDLIKNNVDSTIFKATEKVSQNLVKNIKEIVNERHSKSTVAKKEADTNQVEEKANEKVVLTKEDAAMVAPSWEGKVFSWGFWVGTGGGLLLSADLSNAKYLLVGYEWQVLAAYIRFYPDLYNNLQVSFYADLGGRHVNGHGTYAFTGFKFIPSAGYSVSKKNFHWFVEGGPGLESTNEGFMLGLALGAGAEWLVSKHYSMGLKAGTEIFFNFKPEVYHYENNVAYNTYPPPYYLYTPLKLQLLFTFVY
ncbi:MAG: hypothetical protein OEV78_05385 [Spirochaetia bacterium]|nr:hypothetical protein [Spirochaetia bacterium]